MLILQKMLLTCIFFVNFFVNLLFCWFYHFSIELLLRSTYNNETQEYSNKNCYNVKMHLYLISLNASYIDRREKKCMFMKIITLLNTNGGNDVFQNPWNIGHKKIRKRFVSIRKLRTFWFVSIRRSQTFCFMILIKTYLIMS